jgi:UDP-glucose:(heptosyl)LPS alpha-1,3-glucosyltransferase
MKSVAILKRDTAQKGGLEKYASRIEKAFLKKGCRVTHVGKGKRLSALTNSGKVKEFDAFCADFLQKHPHDIVLSLERTHHQTHLRAGNGVHASYLALRRQHEPWWKRLSLFLNSLHRTILAIEKASFEDPHLKRLFVNSSLVKSQVLKHYTTDPQKIAIIHNGVEWAELETPFNASLERGPSETIHLLFIGHNYVRKGLGQLLHALCRLSSRDFHLDVVGQDKNIRKFQRLARKLGLENYVTFWGHQPSPISFYQKADVLTIPSLYDPFANVTLEGLAMGLFVVSSTTNGGHEVLTQASGVSFDLGDCDAHVAALETALKHPKTKERSLAIRQSVRHLDFSHQLGQLCDLCLS